MAQGIYARGKTRVVFPSIQRELKIHCAQFAMSADQCPTNQELRTDERARSSWPNPRLCRDANPHALENFPSSDVSRRWTAGS